MVINVVASDQTVHGDSTAPGYLVGYGVIDAEQVRELAAAASILVANPLTSPVEALRYQPSAALERAVRCRDLTCRFPGCSRPALVCDIDHTVPFNHEDPAAGGLTVAENLKCLCRQHRQVKTTNRFLRPADGQSQPRHRRDSTNTTRLLTAFTSARAAVATVPENLRT